MSTKEFSVDIKQEKNMEQSPAFELPAHTFPPFIFFSISLIDSSLLLFGRWSKLDLPPSFAVGCPEENAQLCFRDQPLALYLFVFVMIHAAPKCTQPIAQRLQSPHVPAPFGFAALDFNHGVSEIVDGEGNPLGHDDEALPYLLLPRRSLHRDALFGKNKNRILGEEAGQLVRIIAGIAKLSVAELQFLDRLQVFDPLDSFFQFFDRHLLLLKSQVVLSKVISLFPLEAG